MSVNRRVLVGFAYLAGYLLLEYASSLGLYSAFGVTPWSPQTGLTVALIYLGGIFFAPFVFTAPLLSCWIVGPGELSFWVALAAAMTSNATYLGAGLALRQYPFFNPRLAAVRDVLGLIIAAILAAACATAAYVGIVSAANAVPGHALDLVAWRHMVGDIIGILVVCPIMLLAATLRPWPRPNRQHLVQLCTVIIVLAVIFGYRDATVFQLFYLLFIPLLWVALSDGVAGAVLALGVTQVGLIIGAEQRFGTFPGLTALQVLMTTLAATTLLVGAIVTERRVAGQRLRDQQAAFNRALRVRSAGETAAAIAHELNQPLTAVSTYADIASGAIERGDRELAETALEKLRSQCARAASVLMSIRELLGQGRLDQQPVDLNLLVSDVRAVLGGELAASNISLSNEIPKDLPAVSADRVQLEQALHNLVMNSIEAIQESDRPGSIVVSARAGEERDTIIEVRDTGPGFPPGFEDLVSTPFVTSKVKGSGLGLAIARSVAEAHGGSLSIHSSAHGAAVELRLPSSGGSHAGNSVHH